MFNIFHQTQKELEDFFENKIRIAMSPDRIGAKRTKPLSRVNSLVSYSQHETLSLIDLYYNSKFKSGERDSEGQRKYFLNISKFRADVASKMIDLDTKDFLFVPTQPRFIWPVWFLAKQFRLYAKKIKLATLINEIIIDLPKYGSAVVKKVGDEIVRVPLRNLRNTQDAEDLEKADYVIEEHKATRAELKKLAEKNGWNAEEIEVNEDNFDEEIIYYERYGLVPAGFVEENGGEEMVRTMTILTINAKDNEKEPLTGIVLFKERIDELPYRECHWTKQDGRWLGIGEIENQFENQLARNTIANLRRRAMFWGSKKVFQTSDEAVAKNLIRDVKDGQVLLVAPNGQISEVITRTQSLADFNSAEQIWEQNSNQVSFTYEVATGESLPSGTPFRLGVIVASAVKSHFELKRENVGLFLKEIVNDLMLPIFKKQNKEELLPLFADEEGISELRKVLAKIHFNRLTKEMIIERGEIPDAAELRTRIEEELTSRKIIFMKIPQDFYDDIKFYMDLVITGESVDVNAKLETLKTIIQMAATNPLILQEPNMRALLNKAVAMTGENLEEIIGSAPPPLPLGGQRAPSLPSPPALAREASRLTATPGAKEKAL